MSEIKGGSFLVRMLLKTGVFSDVFLREGNDIPFTIENKTGKMAWNGIDLFFKSKTRFLMPSWNMMSGKTEFLITSQTRILLSELHLEASSDGGLVITSGRQWLLIVGKKIRFRHGCAAVQPFMRLMMRK